MKNFLPFALLILLVTSCSQDGDDEDGSSLLDMYNEDGELENDDGTAAPEEEIPYSIGPSEIPDDLVLPE